MSKNHKKENQPQVFTLAAGFFDFDYST